MKLHHWILAAVVLVAAFLLLFATSSASAAPARAEIDALRGRSLYEMRCGGCHGESVHGRTKRQATDFAAIRAWVARWRASLSLDWSEAEVDDVAAYLNATYYHFPCPPTVCTVVSAAPSTPR